MLDWCQSLELVHIARGGKVRTIAIKYKRINLVDQVDFIFL